MLVQVVNQSAHQLPVYKTAGSAGIDLYADLSESLSLKPLDRVLVPTGLFIALPQGFEAQVRPRSGMALKYGLTVLNSPGTIDSDYRGELKVVLVNLSSDVYEVKPGERIAQLVVARYERIEWELVEHLEDTQRGDGGFGSTGH